MPELSYLSYLSPATANYITLSMNISNYCAAPGKAADRQTTSGSNGPGSDNNTPPQDQKRRFNRWIIWALIIVTAALLAGTLIIVLPMVNKTAQHTALIRVRAGASQEQIYDSIAKYLGDNYAENTLHSMRIFANGHMDIGPGAWRIEEGMTPFRAGRLLTRGGQAGIPVVLNDHRTPEEVAEFFASQMAFSKEDMLKALTDKELLAKYDTDPDHVLCFFLKDTYEFYWTATPEDIISAMHDNYRKFWNSERRDKADALRLSTRDVVVLASIVDSETQEAGEKGTIGRLYINRMNEGMKLQSDPTVIYALGDFSIKRVTNAMLQTDNPYNTYRYAGLPPGPIRLTSKATIDAILTSRPHDYMYMCADESLNGSHNFAVTYEEHRHNAERYAAELNRRGI